MYVINYIIFDFREVWPEQNIFGSSEVTSEEELALLKTIFFADIGAESLGKFSCLYVLPEFHIINENAYVNMLII